MIQNHVAYYVVSITSPKVGLQGRLQDYLLEVAWSQAGGGTTWEQADDVTWGSLPGGPAAGRFTEGLAQGWGWQAVCQV